ncbi:hypothetical protein Tco_1468567 [Tanacetum coccineum]
MRRSGESSNVVIFRACSVAVLSGCPPSHVPSLEDQIHVCALGASRGLLGDLSRGLGALLLRLAKSLVKFPCFVILDFGSVLSVWSHGWRQSVDTKVGRSLIRRQTCVLERKKKQSVAMSLAEAEYVAAARCCANILWIKSQLTDYDIIYEKGSPMKKELTLSSVVGMDEGTQNYSLDHIFVGTNTSVLVDKTKSAKNGLKTTHTDLGSLASILEAKDRVAKLKAKVKVAFLKAQPLYPDVNQLTELLFLGLPSKISSVQEKLKTFDILSSLLNKVTNTLNRFATSMENASSKITDKSIPLASQANASPAEREKNTNDADNANLKKQPTTTNPPTTSFQSPLFPKSKGKEVMSSKDAEEEETKSDSNYDHANPADSMVESSKQKKLNKFSLSLKVVNKFILLLRRLKNKRGLKNLSNMSWPNKK